MIRNGEETIKYLKENRLDFLSYKLIQLVKTFNQTIVALKMDVHNYGFDWEDFEEHCDDNNYTILGSNHDKDIIYIGLDIEFKGNDINDYIKDLEEIDEFEC